MENCNEIEIIIEESIVIELHEELPVCATIKGREIDIIYSENGKSAYEIAIKNGFIGTEQEWLLSLKGDKGDTGQVFWSNSNW